MPRPSSPGPSKASQIARPTFTGSAAMLMARGQPGRSRADRLARNAMKASAGHIDHCRARM